MKKDHHRAKNGDKKENKLDLEKLDEETIRKMKQLGYIR
jgi:hypothetical protein